jgi:hypothetical protein
MKRRLNKTLMECWTEKNGGLTEAAKKVEQCLRCSPSKAEKIALGYYPSEISPLEKDALAALVEVPVDVLYLAVGKLRAKAS